NGRSSKGDRSGFAWVRAHPAIVSTPKSQSTSAIAWAWAPILAAAPSRASSTRSCNSAFPGGPGRDPRPGWAGVHSLGGLILLWKQDRRYRAIRLREDPQRLAHLGPVGAQQAVAVQKGHFILHAVLFRY